MLFLLVHFLLLCSTASNVTANNLVTPHETEAVEEEFAAEDALPASPSPSDSISQVSATPVAKKRKVKATDEELVDAEIASLKKTIASSNTGKYRNYVLSIEKKLDELTDFQAAVARKNIEQCLFDAQYNTPQCSSNDTNKSVPSQQMAPPPTTYPSTSTGYPSTSYEFPGTEQERIFMNLQ